MTKLRSSSDASSAWRARTSSAIHSLSSLSSAASTSVRSSPRAFSVRSVFPLRRTFSAMTRLAAARMFCVER
jgi:hypothetical protein